MSSWPRSGEYHKHQKHDLARTLPYGSGNEIKSRDIDSYAWRAAMKGSDVQMWTLQIERSEASLSDQLESGTTN